MLAQVSSAGVKRCRRAWARNAHLAWGLLLLLRNQLSCLNLVLRAPLTPTAKSQIHVLGAAAGKPGDEMLFCAAGAKKAEKLSRLNSYKASEKWCWHLKC